MGSAPRPHLTTHRLSAYATQRLRAMQTPPVGQPPREPTPPSGGGGVDRGGSPTERSLHGALAAAGTHGTMTDTPTAPPGLSAEERLLAALREAEAGGATAPSVGTPGFGLPGSSSETTHGAFSMPPPSSLFPPSTTTNADVSNVGLTAHPSFPNLGVGLTAHNSPDVGLTAHGGSRPQQPPHDIHVSGLRGRLYACGPSTSSRLGEPAAIRLEKQGSVQGNVSYHRQEPQPVSTELSKRLRARPASEVRGGSARRRTRYG